jgi:hypothetical protein
LRRIFGMACPEPIAGPWAARHQFDSALQDPARDAGDHEREVVLYLARARLVARLNIQQGAVDLGELTLANTRSNTVAPIAEATRAWIAKP